MKIFRAEAIECDDKNTVTVDNQFQKSQFEKKVKRMNIRGFGAMTGKLHGLGRVTLP